MFEFLLSIRVSFWLVRVGRMPRRCAATASFMFVPFWTTCMISESTMLLMNGCLVSFFILTKRSLGFYRILCFSRSSQKRLINSWFCCCQEAKGFENWIRAACSPKRCNKWSSKFSIMSWWCRALFKLKSGTSFVRFLVTQTSSSFSIRWSFRVRCIAIILMLWSKLTSAVSMYPSSLTFCVLSALTIFLLFSLGIFSVHGPNDFFSFFLVPSSLIFDQSVPTISYQARQ